MGYDQSAVHVMGELGYSNLLKDQAQGSGAGGEHILSKFESIFWPDEARMGVRSLGSSVYWKKNLSKCASLFEFKVGRLLKLLRPVLYRLKTPSCTSHKTWGCLPFSWCKLMQGIRKRKKNKFSCKITSNEGESSKLDPKGKGASSPEKVKKTQVPKLDEVL